MQCAENVNTTVESNSLIPLIMTAILPGRLTLL